MNDTQTHGKVLCNFIQSMPIADANLDAQVQQFWKLDCGNVLDDTLQLSVDDQRVVDTWNSSKMMVDGHYQLHVPFCDNLPNLPNNYALAENRLRWLEKRFHKDEALKEKYVACMQDLFNMFNKGYAEKVSEENKEGPAGKTWYLPHYNEIHKQKPDKLRIVFNCAARYTETSLNINILQGPDLTNRLIGVL